MKTISNQERCTVYHNFCVLLNLPVLVVVPDLIPPFAAITHPAVPPPVNFLQRKSLKRISKNLEKNHRYFLIYSPISRIERNTTKHL